MDIQYLKRLIKLVNESQISEIEIEEEGSRIRITRTAQSPALPAVQQLTLPVAPVAVEAVATPEIAQKTTETPEVSAYHELRSPIVGTFYRSPSPDSDPFVQVGHNIAAGDTLCIIEAMKIMNEIEADVSGRIVKVLVENAQPVEYNQPLFLIDPS